MHNARDGRLQAEIATAAVDADVIGEALGVTPEAERIVGLIEITSAEHELRLVVAFETGSGHDVEHTVGSISKLGAVTTAIHFQVVDVLGIELRADIGSDVGVGHGQAIDEPGGLMASSDMQLIVRNVCAGNIVSDHCQAVRAVSAGRALNVGPIDKSRRSGTVGGDDVRRGGDVDLLICGSQLQLK